MRAILLLAVTSAFAQPYIGYVYPAGGRHGTTFEVTVGGQALNGVNVAYVTGSGARARVLGYERPLTPVQANALREEAQGLQKKRQAAPAAFPPADLQRLMEIRQRLAKFMRRPMNPAIAETVRLEIVLDPDAAPGRRELRLSAPTGLTNPLAFHIGTLPESAGRSEIALPVVVNGQIMPGAVDRYRFTASKGQRLVATAAARELIPYISDAVPGWFQATLTLRDAAGREVRYSDHDAFRPDPVLTCEIPADGPYTLEIKDSIYRGREDFVYRLAIQEPRDTTPSAVLPKPPKKLKPGTTVAGRIDRPGEEDVYRFDGKAGDAIVAEIVARRAGSPLDSILRLTDSKGKELAVNDDTKDEASGLLTHHADSYIAVKLPAKGTYSLHVADSQNKGGLDYTYRLRVSRPQPDFELRVAPSGINARSGVPTPVTVQAIRRDGFNDEIALALKDAGFRLDGAVIPAGQSRVRVTLTPTIGPSEVPVKLTLEGRATIAGREVRHTAAPSDDMMQAFYYHHLAPASDLLVRVLGPARPPVQWKPVSDQPVQLRAGEETTVQIPAPVQRLGGTILFTLNDPPEGITVQSVNQNRDSVSVVLRADPTKAKPGLKGNLILDAFVERLVPNAKQPGAKRKQPLGTLPATPFEVVAR